MDQIPEQMTIEDLQIHAASMLNEYGCVAKNEFYTHYTPEPEPEPTPEPEA